MATLKEEAQAYEPQQTKNIADLEVVNIDEVNVLESEEKKDKDGKPFRYKYFVKDGEKYRVPSSVLEEIQSILEVKPKTKFIKVTKSGSGLNTKYKVIQVD